MGLESASVRARAALTAASEEELLGTVKLWRGESNSFYDVFRSGFWDIYFVVPVVFRGAADVPPGDAMG